MEEKELNTFLMDELTILNDLEISKAKVLAIIFRKTTQDIVSKKIQSMKINFEEQAKFYDQDIVNYENICDEMLKKYKNQLTQIINEYNQLFINIYLELQEAECNQKIAITNLKKSYDIKQKLISIGNIAKTEEYRKKINACILKKENYDIIIKECEKKLDECTINIEKQMNSQFTIQSNQIALKEESFIQKIIHKIKNLFSGKTKFNTYVIEPISVELEMTDDKLPDMIEQIQEDIILFVAKIKQAKAETNEIFNQMI